MTSESLVVPTGRMIELGREESLALLASVPVGRIGFTGQALPVVRLVNHLVDGDSSVIRTHPGSALLSATGIGQVVVYEAGCLDLHARIGWNVMVTGRAVPVTASSEAPRHRRLHIPWFDGAMDHVVQISAKTVTGHRLAR
ncbi:pyridoxamine 5'-phosphate oxidase family protein [Streptomyces sp. NPDC050523]|uniref:pyridoxamine 5'-phosphate oxidase family protein n=1 Tax=Streptomyces sp. NPDC050523 TaxID=3365622 RepID=UPI0037925C8C